MKKYKYSRREIIKRWGLGDGYSDRDKWEKSLVEQLLATVPKKHLRDITKELKPPQLPTILLPSLIMFESIDEYAWAKQVTDRLNILSKRV